MEIKCHTHARTRRLLTLTSDRLCSGGSSEVSNFSNIARTNRPLQFIISKKKRSVPRGGKQTLRSTETQFVGYRT